MSLESTSNYIVLCSFKEINTCICPIDLLSTILIFLYYLLAIAACAAASLAIGTRNGEQDT